MKTEGCWYSQYYWIENEYTGEIYCVKKGSPVVEEFEELRDLEIKERIKQCEKQLQKKDKV